MTIQTSSIKMLCTILATAYALSGYAVVAPPTLPAAPKLSNEQLSALCRAPNHYTAKTPLQPWCGCQPAATMNTTKTPPTTATTSGGKYAQDLKALKESEMPENCDSDAKNEKQYIKKCRDLVNFDEMKKTLRGAASQCKSRAEGSDDTYTNLELPTQQIASQRKIDHQYAKQLEQWARNCDRATGTYHDGTATPVGQKHVVKKCIKHFVSLFNAKEPKIED